MFLERTPKALRELMPGQRTLSLRERSLLLLAQGLSRTQLQALYHGEGGTLVTRLIRQGYLQEPGKPSSILPEPASVAGVRMHLFDLCERFFAQRAPETALQLRSELRKARDVDSMLQFCEEMLQIVAQHAGAERAHALRQQISRLLPGTSLETSEGEDV